MSLQSLTSSHYQIPPLNQHVASRCRDCAEMLKQKQIIVSNIIKCRLHDEFIRHSHRCDDWHSKGTLF